MIRSVATKGVRWIAPLLLFLVTASAPGSSFSLQDWNRYFFEYHLQIPPQEGEKISIWIPFPVEDKHQKVIRTRVDSPFPWEIRSEKKFGNKLIYLEGNSPTIPLDITLSFEVERRAATNYPPSLSTLYDPLNPDLYLAADRLVPLDRQIRSIAKEATEGLENSAEKIQALYHYVIHSMTYNKEGTGWGRGDAIWACNNKRGNCTDFHSLFIALARAEGIPARFVIGFSIPEGKKGTIPGYHCWAEYYDHEKGWLPVDATEGKKAGRPEDYFGQLPNNRIQFTVGRDLVLNPPQEGQPLNYFIYSYVEVDGHPLANVTHDFRFERLARY